MHAIVMVHKMQRMALSSQSLLPSKAQHSENTRISESNKDTDEADGPKEDDQGEGSWSLTKQTTQHKWNTPDSNTQITLYTVTMLNNVCVHALYSLLDSETNI